MKINMHARYVGKCHLVQTLSSRHTHTHTHTLTHRQTDRETDRQTQRPTVLYGQLKRLVIYRPLYGTVINATFNDAFTCARRDDVTDHVPGSRPTMTSRMMSATSPVGLPVMRPSLTGHLRRLDDYVITGVSHPQPSVDTTSCSRLNELKRPSEGIV